MLKRSIFGAIAISVWPGVHALAQQPSGNTIVLYSEGRFKGARITLDGPMRLSTPFTAKSIQIPPGKSWELCNGNSFTGCKEFNASDNGMVFNIRSARPVASIIASTNAQAAKFGTIDGGPWPSLRGLASEYFIAPDTRGSRILVASRKSEEASRVATDFCRARGWRKSTQERLQSIDGRAYLADVLCGEGE
ncbi:MAG TPA: hypothetical protein VGD23_00555 [Sphingomicrobium sp.]